MKEYVENIFVSSGYCIDKIYKELPQHSKMNEVKTLHPANI